MNGKTQGLHRPGPPRAVNKVDAGNEAGARYLGPAVQFRPEIACYAEHAACDAHEHMTRLLNMLNRVRPPPPAPALDPTLPVTAGTLISDLMRLSDTLDSIGGALGELEQFI